MIRRVRTGPEGVPVGEASDGGSGRQPLAPPGAAFGPPGLGAVDEPPPNKVGAPAPAGRLASGFWPVPCLLVADDGGARLRIPVAGGTSVHAVVAATVRSSLGSVIEIETLEGRRFRYAPVADVRVVPGQVLTAGAVLGTVDGEHAAHLELAVRDPDGRWVDPYPLLVGLADPNELGVDARTGDGIDPDALVRSSPRPDRVPARAAEPAVAEPVAAEAHAAPAPLPPPPPPAPTPVAPVEPARVEPAPVEAAPRVSADILAAMIAPAPPRRAEPADE
ncbi:MAG: hypothetical protein QOD72_3139 [Acidimicrobiaceae bacterium]|jgi:hypothetical protein|nr:hypothetical protein [Acidimicrobiaceae bacterium]